MERHRNEQRFPLRAVDVAEHEMGKGLRKPGAAAIFELQSHLARDLAISDGGSKAVEGRRIGEAAAANSLLLPAIFEGQPASRAAGLAEKGQRAPAVEAETVGLADDSGAARAARRKREVEHLAQRGMSQSGGRGGHGPSVARTAPLRNPGKGNSSPRVRDI